MEKENREHKDSLFVDLFYQDETIIRKVKIDDVLYKNFKNDISFEVNGQVLVFGEYQSTVNMNMCLRCLMYVGRAYEQLVDRKARYRTTLVKIPTPEFYTFYNGKKEQPLERVLSLSDAFMNPAGENSVELKVKVININSDKAHELLGKCGILKEYSQFISMVRKYSDEESAIKKAIRECMEQGILSDYLKRKGSEVENMLIAEYSYEEDIQVKQEEAMQQGVQKGIRQGRQEGLILCGKIFQAVKKNPDFTNEQIALKLACSVEEVESTKKMFGI